MDSSVCIPDGIELNSQYSSVQDSDKYSSAFQNCNNMNIHRSNSPLMGSKLNSPGYFDQDHKPCVLGSQTQLSANSQEILNSHLQERSLLSPVRYVQTSQYMGMADYADTADTTCQLDSQFLEEPAIAYGYLTDANYRLPNDNTYSTRPMLFNENFAGSETTMMANTNNHVEFQNDTPLVSHIRDAEKEIIDGLRKDMFSSMRWRDPNLSEVISFLNNPSNTVKANAAAYLQHLCYMDDPNKQRTRTLGGIPPLVCLLSYEAPEIHKNACGALRNLSYGRQNDENKRAVKNAGGITSLVSLLCRSQESEVKELVTGVLWNLSSCEDIKRSIIDESLTAIVRNIIKPHSGWDELCPGETCYSTVFRNASGVVRNISSAGEYARIRLRNEEFLVDCLLYVIKQSIEKNNIGNKTVENCVCILRNLSYRCQEVEDPFYDKQLTIASNKSSSSTSKGENLGCFGTTKKKKALAAEERSVENSYSASYDKNSASKNTNHKRYERLWQPEIVQYYLVLLQSCSNPETLEAAAGAIQNLSACYWQASIDIRATVRKEKGLPILVELLRMEVDRVVCAVATALRNLAIDQRNKELIGKYAMRDLVQKLPSGNPQHDMNTSDDTITAVLATINEVIKKNTEFARSLLDSGGVERLMNITRNRQIYTACVLRFASQVLFTLWQHSELREIYKRNGWKENDFITKSFATFNSSLNSPNNINNTLNRPMASQGRTRYEDRTLQRGSGSASRGNNTSENEDCKERTMLRSMVDEIAVNGARDEAFLLPVGENASVQMYIPIVNGDSNNTN